MIHRYYMNRSKRFQLHNNFVYCMLFQKVSHQMDMSMNKGMIAMLYNNWLYSKLFLQDCHPRDMSRSMNMIAMHHIHSIPSNNHHRRHHTIYEYDVRLHFEFHVLVNVVHIEAHS